jgi:2-dehydro-3-deoxygluconokinase
VPEPVYCLGETMAVVATVDGASLVDGDAFLVATGGAESNVAVHLADLGRPAIWLSRVGLDPLGDRILRSLDLQGVDVSQVERVYGERTGVYFKDRIPGGTTRVYYYRDGSAASRMDAANLANWRLPDRAIVHMSGITPALSRSCSRLVDAVLDSSCRVSFDVNYRKALWPVEHAAPELLRRANRANLVFVGLDEAADLWGASTPQDVADLLPAPQRLVVKDGAREAVEFLRSSRSSAKVFRESALSADVLEPVGAGDAFAAGYLAALLGGADAQTRLREGHRRAVWNIGSMHDVRTRGQGEHV